MDLSGGEHFPRAIGQAKVISDHEEKSGGTPQSLLRRALLGEMVKVTEPFLDQRTGLVAGQRIRMLEKLMEHSRTS